MNMLKFIELMTIKNVTELKHVSMYITKASEIRKNNNFSLIKQAPHSCMYIANVLIHNCNYMECIYVCLLHVVL